VGAATVKRDRIYIILAGEDILSAPRCKIGYTQGDPLQRMRDLQCGSPVKLGLYCYFDGGKKAERILHETFAPLNTHGEWFEIRAKLHDFLCYLMEDAANGGEVSGETLCVAVCDVILAENTFHPSQNLREYLESADTKHWDFLREPLARDIAAGVW
jgi:hypothetical protein